MRNILFTIFLLIFTFSVPFPLFLQKTQKIHEIHVLESLDILIEKDNLSNIEKKVIAKKKLNHRSVIRLIYLAVRKKNTPAGRSPLG